MASPQYITDKNGKKVSDILPIKEYKRILEELEDAEDIKLYNEVKEANEPYMPIDKAFEMIDAKRKRNNSLSGIN